jgi:hypothetical protein
MGNGIVRHLIDFEKGTAIESQVLVDFITNWMEPANYTEGSIIELPWHVYCDRA